MMVMLRTHRWKMIGAFAMIYLYWGSTYLAIRYAIDTIPPFFMAGCRFFLGGLILFLWVRIRNQIKPTIREWSYAALVGTLLMVGGTGMVTWAEQYVPSGLAALMIATVPLWIVLLEWLRPNGQRPKTLVVLGVVIGLGGVAFLMAPEAIAGQGRIQLVGAVALLFACLSWSVGSISSRHVPKTQSPFLNASMQLLVAGVVLFGLAGVTGEYEHFSVSSVSLDSILAFAYLTSGGMIAITAYLWLLQVTEPARVATYAYVNPIIAISLGTVLAGEIFTPRILVSALIIVSGVAAIVTASYRKKSDAIQTEIKVPAPVATISQR